eukprot:5859730-Pyramimonas_sp.AAC.1
MAARPLAGASGARTFGLVASHIIVMAGCGITLNFEITEFKCLIWGAFATCADNFNCRRQPNRSDSSRS